LQPGNGFAQYSCLTAGHWLAARGPQKRIHFCEGPDTDRFRP
jgi:hypothetical protein